MNNKVKVLFVAIALAAGFYLPGMLKQVPTADVDLSSYCMLSEEVCEQQGVKLRVDSQRITPLTPIQIEVFWPNATSDTLSIALQGKEMDMGVAKYQLTMIKPDVYQSEIILPVCSEERMTWFGTVSDGETNINAALRMTAR
ncbi:hypothetical protein [Vibrio hangzhouensis]|uniref:hypothetical protein n=1 Tax=Vibrio hangzhouensis TaxID=462991 RepID=UPI001C9487DA|nr:hypothetical protein [Vibrio hangzhouensis]MBY6195839.1 hypothetical protein [Vibrio hangzhouensis]